MRIESIDPTLGNDYPLTPHPFERRPTLLIEPSRELLQVASSSGGGWMVQVLVDGTPGGMYDGYRWARLVSTMKRPVYFELTQGKKYYLKLYDVWKGYPPRPSAGQGLGTVRVVIGAAVPDNATLSATQAPAGISVYRSSDDVAPQWVPCGPVHGYPAPL